MHLQHLCRKHQSVGLCALVCEIALARLIFVSCVRHKSASVLTVLKHRFGGVVFVRHSASILILESQLTNNTASCLGGTLGSIEKSSVMLGGNVVMADSIAQSGG